MIKPKQRRFHYGLQTSPWVIIGSVVILLVTIVVLALQNYHREEGYVSSVLSEKGAALIRTIEAGARTGMMRMMWGGDQVQSLIEESALAPEVLYIMVITPQGRVLAASEKKIIGTQARDRAYLKTLDPSGKIGWEITSTIDQGRSFEVFKYFNPISNRAAWMKQEPGRQMRNREMMMGRENDWCFPAGNGEKGRSVIVVGLDPGPYEMARGTDIRNTMIISVVLIILGVAGFVSMYWMQNYRAAQKALQDTSAIADEVVASLPVGLIATDKEGKIAFYNGAAERITGLDLSEARGKMPENILPGNFCDLRSALDRGASIIEKEMTCEFAVDNIVPVSVSASKIINEVGQFIGQVLILRDLREVRRLQEAVRRQEKMAAIGGLAAGVAHEIRNPLSSIKGLASYFRSKFDDRSEDKEAADVMIQEVDRLNRVISELLDFVHPTDLQVKPIDLNELVAHSVRLIQQEANAKDIRIHIDAAAQPLMADVDADRLSQCLLNLFLNALQAMVPGDRLTVVAGRAAQSIRIDVEDTGRGIPDEDLDKIFDPYFTTKAKGTGLGLAIVHKIIEAHKGHLKVQSVPGQGTKVSIILPTPKVA
jgi:two-component system, NtrC family, sensor histidine kinase HydH